MSESKGQIRLSSEKTAEVEMQKYEKLEKIGEGKVEIQRLVCK